MIGDRETLIGSATERESRLAINDRETKVGTEGSSSSSAARRGTERERELISWSPSVVGTEDEKPEQHWLLAHIVSADHQ